MVKRHLKQHSSVKKIKSNGDESILKTSKFTPDAGDPESEDWDNEEQDYELKPRKSDLNFTDEGLPIKDGGVLRRTERRIENADEESDEPVREIPSLAKEEDMNESLNAESLSPSQRLLLIKEEIGSLAADLMQDPEENWRHLIKLRRAAESEEPAKSHIAILALVPVFKALAPGYKIRPLTESEKKAKVSRDVAKLRDLEQGLLGNYQTFLTFLDQNTKSLMKSSKNLSKFQESRALVSLNAVCELALSSLKHFNWNDTLIWILVRNMDSLRIKQLKPELDHKILRTLESLLKEDGDSGSISLIICRFLSKRVQKKDYRVDESVFNILLNLSVLDDFIVRDENPAFDSKFRKQKKQHLSKKERKARKEAKSIALELQRAETAVTAEAKENNQAQILRIVLRLYLETLKSSSQGNSHASNLVALSLEGISRFGPSANLDLLGDFILVMRECIENLHESICLAELSLELRKNGLYNAIDVRQTLLLIATSFVLLLNNRESGKLPFSVDLSRFVNMLYRALSDISLDADLELSSKSLRLTDPLASGNEAYKPSVNFATHAELLLRCLDYIFFRSKSGSSGRALLFIKRLYMMNLHAPEKTVLADLKFIDKLSGKFSGPVTSLWSTDETINEEGSYVLGFELSNVGIDIEKSNAENATLWEQVLLDRHYSPMVRKSSSSLSKKAVKGRA